MRKLLIAMPLFGLRSGCVAIPANVKAVEDFGAEGCAGMRYEIARLENASRKD